jgi:SOS response regulatory protein OraA/RecX
MFKCAEDERDDALERWIARTGEDATPEDWAEEALQYARVRHTRRRFLRPHLARVIREAQEIAVRKALRERTDQPID